MKKKDPQAEKGQVNNENVDKKNEKREGDKESMVEEIALQEDSSE